MVCTFISPLQYSKLTWHRRSNLRHFLGNLLSVLQLEVSVAILEKLDSVKIPEERFSFSLGLFIYLFIFGPVRMNF